MIKCNVKVCGTVSRAAVVRANRDGKPFMTYGLDVVFSPKNGINKTVNVNVIKDSGDAGEAAKYKVGSRIQMDGVLTFKKRGEALYLDLSETAVDFFPVDTKDSIEGEMTFRGSPGKNIDMKRDKKDKPYLAFSAYSAEKVSDGFEYTWVRFIRFSDAREDFLSPKTPIEATGELDLSVYNDKLNIGCRLASVNKWDKKPYQPANEEMPF